MVTLVSTFMETSSGMPMENLYSFVTAMDLLPWQEFFWPKELHGQRPNYANKYVPFECFQTHRISIRKFPGRIVRPAALPISPGCSLNSRNVLERVPRHSLPVFIAHLDFLRL